MAAETTWGEALREAAARLAGAGVPSARLDARLLLADALGVEPHSVAMHPENPLPEAAAQRFSAAVARRARREPVARILGRREFWSLPFALGLDTLDPRPDTETLVEAVLAEIPERDRGLRLLDFGTGTGCILLALLSELPNASGLGVDISEGALAVARANAEALGLANKAEFVSGDWGSGLDGLFDAIVANPPYIPDDEISGLAPEVAAYDPHAALAGGVDGLACYRALVPDLARLLAPEGAAALEVGQGQAAAVARLLEDAGLEVVSLRRDLAGVERCIVAKRPRTAQKIATERKKELETGRFATTLRSTGPQGCALSFVLRRPFAVTQNSQP